MERLSDTAIAIINDLHTERLDYQSEYLPLIDAAHRLAAYEDTGLVPEEVCGLCEMGRRAKMANLLRLEEYRALGPIDHLRELVQAEQERENPEPLTLDELREMGGKPVFIQSCKVALPGKWKVIQYVTDREVGFTDNTSLYLPQSSPAAPCYGKAWLAYRHKPEGDAK